MQRYLAITIKIPCGDTFDNEMVDIINRLKKVASCYTGNIYKLYNLTHYIIIIKTLINMSITLPFYRFNVRCFKDFDIPEVDICHILNGSIHLDKDHKNLIPDDSLYEWLKDEMIFIRTFNITDTARIRIRRNDFII